MTPLRSFFPLIPVLTTFWIMLCATPAPGAMEEVERRVVEETLPNGLRVIVLPRHQSPTVSLYLRFQVGAVEEREGKSGLAHLLEHMMFKGTTTLGTRDWRREKPLREEIDRLAGLLDGERARGPGASPERIEELQRQLRQVQEEARRYVVKDEIGSLYTSQGAQGLNASTSADLTTYKVSIPSNRIGLWARIEASRLKDPVMREFYSERDVVIEERRQNAETDPGRKLMALLLATAYKAHPYGRPVIGWEGDVEHLSQAAAEEFLLTNYVPGNAVLAAVGDVEPRDFLDLVRTHFGSLPSRKAPSRRQPVEPVQEGERRAVLLMDARPAVMIAFHKPTLPEEEDYVFDLIDGVLTRGRTSRLYRSLVEEKQLALSVGSTNGVPGTRFPNLFVLRAVPRHPHTAAEVEEELLRQLEVLRQEPVAEEELQRVRNQLRAAMIRGLRSNAGMASRLSYFEAVAGDWRYIARHLDILEKITPARIREVAERYLDARNRSVVTLVQDRPGEEEE